METMKAVMPALPLINLYQNMQLNTSIEKDRGLRTGIYLDGNGPKVDAKMHYLFNLMQL